MIKFFLIFVTTCITLTAAPNAGGVANRKLLVESERILFLGDSITHKGKYVSNFESWLKALYPKRNFDIINLGLPSETISGLSEDGHAKGKFPRPYLFTRVYSVFEKTKPDLVFACYGMNCGITLPFDEQRFKKYREGIVNLKALVEKNGAQIIFITPPIIDENRKTKWLHYREVLEKYSTWLISKRAEGWHVIDLQSHMRDALDKERVSDKNFTYQKDAIHPNNAGHWIMTQPILHWFGDPTSAKAVSVDEMVNLHKQPASTIPLIEKRMKIKRSAWLTHTGHTRPGIKKGMPLEQLEIQEEKLTKEIEDLLKLAGQ